MTLYTVENGMITWYVNYCPTYIWRLILPSIATVLSLIFVSVLYLLPSRKDSPIAQWLAKPHALIYLGLHFAISKRMSSIPSPVERALIGDPS